jgi:hypothetical protein
MPAVCTGEVVKVGSMGDWDVRRARARETAGEEGGAEVCRAR